ncbi:MAG: 2-iminoacetate synthase ThiH [Sedimentisphaerales bacterium]|nr:2-iminoacetate synthase ThiH [Sedimentisphaerales bacterium]
MLSIQKILSDLQLDGHGQTWLEKLENISEEQVLNHLKSASFKYSLDRITTLLSPAAELYVEQMAQMARKLTIQRVGRTVQLYAPLYVSNHCVNSCVYCGYNITNDFKRTRLSIEEAMADAEVIAKEGFRHILIVSGEDREFITIDYLCELAKKLRGRFSSISIEIYPMEQDEYAELFAAGIDGVTLYQETYDRSTYAKYHVKGPKSDYDHRLESHDRIASAGMRRIGLGVLLGLADWRTDATALAVHADYLMKHYWQSQVSFSFPRVRPALNVLSNTENIVTDKGLVQMMLALRLCFPDAGIVLSTRERASLRDELVKICVTRMSAGSKTNPGGYSLKVGSTEQFEVDDSRSASKIASMIKSVGSEPVWKDWDAAFSKP